jgi:hypothetical protein
VSAHRARGGKHRVIQYATCQVCVKQGFPSRREARRAARTWWPDKRMRVYEHEGVFHLTSQTAATTERWRDDQHGTEQEDHHDPDA